MRPVPTARGTPPVAAPATAKRSAPAPSLRAAAVRAVRAGGGWSRSPPNLAWRSSCHDSPQSPPSRSVDDHPAVAETGQVDDPLQVVGRAGHDDAAVAGQFGRG